jgi:hypothetical protein
MLDRSTDRRSCCGAAVVNLAHSASFHSRVKSAPSNPGIKQLASALERFTIELQSRSFSMSLILTHFLRRTGSHFVGKCSKSPPKRFEVIAGPEQPGLRACPPGGVHDDGSRSAIQRLGVFDPGPMARVPPVGSNGTMGPPQPVQIEAPSLFMRSSRFRSASLLLLAPSAIFVGSNLTLDATPSMDRSVDCPEPIPAPAGRASTLDLAPERKIAQIIAVGNSTAFFCMFIERPLKNSLYHKLRS